MFAAAARFASALALCLGALAGTAPAAGAASTWSPVYPFTPGNSRRVSVRVR